MIEKVKLNEVAKDLNISGKDLTALLQQRFGGEAKKPQTVLSGEELSRLAAFHRAPQRNHRGLLVGEIVADLELEPA